MISSAVLSLLLISATYSNSVFAQNKFRAKLDANNEIPPVDSKASGHATFKIKNDSIKSKVNITGITDISGAQIFAGKIGQNTDPIVDLLKTGEKTETSGGVAITGNFTASDLEGSMKGKDLSELQSAMAANGTFVNIMTTAHPDGEAAGHIYAKGSTTGAQNEVSSSDATGQGSDQTDESTGNNED
jgi:hypothetical protein